MTGIAGLLAGILEAGVDPKVAYWTWAWLNMAGIVVLALLGVRQVGQGGFQRHRRMMLTASSLVALFVLSYVVKLALLGREQLETWDARYVHVLRVHELCVLAMVVAGSTALYQAFKLGLPLAGGEPGAVARGTHIHRRAGAAAVGAATLGVATAAYVLFGMYSRLWGS